jgi:hypothetical protein
VKQKPLNALPVSACVLLDGRSGLGFALPLFADPAAMNRWLVQDVDEASERIAGFRKLEDHESEVIPITNGPIAHVNGPQIYTFVTKDGKVIAGELRELEPILRAFLDHSVENAVRLQIVELVGTATEKRNERQRMRQIILQKSGPVAAESFYQGSVLRIALWGVLLSKASDKDAAKRILMARNKVDIRVEQNGEINVDLSALNPEDYSNLPTSQIISNLEEEFQPIRGHMKMTESSPGSFTKNFGWNQRPPGLRALYDAIQAGFGGIIANVSRDEFRARCGIADRDRQLIPLNFFLHNTIRGKGNFVSVDELVRQALLSAHSPRFDRLALFAFHLARVGTRLGNAGTPSGADFANGYVRSQLWEDDGWKTSNLTEDKVEKYFAKAIKVRGKDTLHKCVTNYLYLMEVCGLRYQSATFVDTALDQWAEPALFLAFDRYLLDHKSINDFTLDCQALRPKPGKFSVIDDLLKMIETDEIYKLMGASSEYVRNIAPSAAERYLKERWAGPWTGPTNAS